MVYQHRARPLLRYVLWTEPEIRGRTEEGNLQPGCRQTSIPYFTSSRHSPHAGADMDAAPRSSEAGILRNSSIVSLPRPTSIKVPTIARTIPCRKRLASISKRRQERGERREKSVDLSPFPFLLSPFSFLLRLSTRLSLNCR